MPTAYKLAKQKEQEVQSFANSLENLDVAQLNAKPESFQSLIGLEVEDYFEDFELLAVQVDESMIVSKNEAKSLGFHLTGVFSYGTRTIEEKFTLWISEYGNCKVSGFQERVSTRTLHWRKHVAPLLVSLGLIPA